MIPFSKGNTYKKYVVVTSKEVATNSWACTAYGCDEETIVILPATGYYFKASSLVWSDGISVMPDNMYNITLKDCNSPLSMM